MCDQKSVLNAVIVLVVTCEVLAIILDPLCVSPAGVTLAHAAVIVGAGVVVCTGEVSQGPWT